MVTSSDVIRVGRVSSVDYTNGMVSVVYPDRDSMVTRKLPYFCHCGEYMMPAIDDEVIVCHLSDNSANGVVMGKFWDADNKPPVSGAGKFYKSLGGESYMSCTGDEITFHDKHGTITLAEIIALKG